MSDCVEAEQALIGGLLIDSSVITEVDVEPSDFGNANYAAIFEAIKGIQSEGEVADVFTVADRLNRGSEQNWLPSLAAIQKNTISTRNIGTYSKHIKRFAVERKATLIAQDLLEALRHDGLSAVDAAISQLMALESTPRKSTHTLKESLRAAMDHIEKIQGMDGLSGVRTGLTELDDLMGGFHDSDLCIIGARPAMGKTGLLINLALNSNIPCGIFSTEQAHDQIALRSISMTGSVNSQNLRTAKLNDNDWAGITAALGLLAEKHVFIDDKSRPTIAQVCRQARKWKLKHGIKILYVDYIQRLQATDTRLPKHQQVEEIVVGLKTLAKELDIPIVALAQVNREVEKRTDRRPGMGDLKDSGAIEQEADEIIMLYRDEVYNPDTEFKGIAELNIEKNRHGPIGCVKAAWIGQYMRFEDLKPDEYWRERQ
ncbi:MAG: replicative DNA helicase [Gammaproteobacteria bacterium]|nr:replicative DNA helicase [Gammaproteobacteria bacterium]